MHIMYHVKVFQALIFRNVGVDSTPGTLLNTHLYFSLIQQYLLSTYYTPDIPIGAEEVRAAKRRQNSLSVTLWCTCA